MEAASRLTLQSAPKLLQPRFEVGFSMQVIRRTPLEVSSSQMFYCALQPLVRNVVPVGMQPRCRPVGYLLPRSCSIDQSKQLFFDVIPTRPGIRSRQCKSCAKFFQPVLKVRLSMEVGRRTSLEIGTRKYADGVPKCADRQVQDGRQPPKAWPSRRPPLLSRSQLPIGPTYLPLLRW